jgi:hypothetical protein
MTGKEIRTGKWITSQHLRERRLSGKKAEKKIGQKEKWLEYQPIRGGVLS